MSTLTECEPAEAFANNDLSLLGPTRVKQIRQFFHSIRSCGSETTRYELCLDKRDELLEKQDQLLGERVRLHIEFAFYEPAFSESITYKIAKEKDQRWQKFAGDAALGRKSQVRWTAELKNAAARWGEELVQHYAGDRGVNFAVELARTARKHPEWKIDALPRFQQLVCRRIQLIEKHGRHSFMHPLERIDLLNARSWDSNDPYIKQNDPDQVSLPLSALREEDLPYGYEFDQYGLIAPNQSVLESLQTKALGIAVHPIIDIDWAKEQSAQTATEQDISTHTFGEGAINSTAMSIAGCAIDTNRSSSGVLEAVIGSSQLVDDITHEPRDSMSGAKSTTTSGGDESGCRLDFGLSSRGVTDLGNECSSPHTSSPMVLRKSSRVLAKNRVAQGIEHIPENASFPIRDCGRKYGSRHQRHAGEDARRATAARRSEALQVDQLKTLAGRLPAMLSAYTWDSSPIPSSGFKRKRAASLPPGTSYNCDPNQHEVTNPGSGTDETLVHDGQTLSTSNFGQDDAFLTRARMEVSKRARESPGSHGVQTAMRLLPILRDCKQPNADENQGPIEVHHLSGHLAKEFLSLNTSYVPIVTEQQQHFKWKDTSRPMAEFFEWMEDLDRMISVQIPSLPVDRNSYERHSLRQVQKRLLSHDRSEDPWNILDCSCPLPSVLPDFLTSWNCQLLARIRQMVVRADGAERAVTTRGDWTQWREIEHWTLLSEGGHCTAPHIDSHGLATWITIQQGVFGFTWMSRPTCEQRTRWMEDTQHYDEGQQWRFLVLRPGQTIFFPSGTIHGVFRVHDAKTLALGGHILQWTGVNQWAEMIKKQTMYPDSTNEDVSDAWKWIPIVEDLLRKRLERSRLGLD